MQHQKTYEELTIRDYFMFGKICSKPENRKLILDSLLQIDFHEKRGEVEKYLQEFKDAKYARLDLLVEDNDGTVYDAEMQNESSDKSRQTELPKRSRYYQSLIDTAYLNTGGEYRNLPDVYIIFICTFDPFGKNLPIYTFETKCLEKDIPLYDDKVHKLFFNTTADLSKLPQDARNMLEYINSGTTNDKATVSLNNEVIEARLKEEWKAEYMLTLVHDKDVFREGYESRQEEVDTLKATIDDIREKKDAEINRILNEFEEYKRTHN